MDPITAFGLATNILTFVEFAREIVITSRDIYQSSTGATAKHLESETLAYDIKKRVQKTTFPRVLDESLLLEEDKSLRDLSRQCQAVADELLRALEKLQVEGRYKKWKSFYQAIRSVKNKDEIDDLERRLDKLNAQVNARTIAKQLTAMQARISVLQNDTVRLNAARSHEMRELMKHIDILFKQLMETSFGQDSRLDHILEQLSLSTQRGAQFSAEQQVLKFLSFKSMNERYLSLDQAHKGTFTWINDPATVTSPHGGYAFLQWLQSDDHSIYWISGKLGSGKSTLMRYLCDLPAVQTALTRWANGRGYSERQLVAPKYFFWSSGRDSLQKSQEGLLPSLLYQTLQEHPDLIPSVFPDQWEAYTSSGGLRRDEFDSSYLTVSELTRATQRLLTQASQAKALLFCFFIDGLDEYKGKMDDIIQLIKVLKTSNLVKMCVSSRPWNEFEKVFGGNDRPVLRLQDLNYEDIRLYVQDTLEGDTSFQEMKEDDDRCQDLIHEIVRRADGVFFWVRLVVNSLLQGLTNADRIVDLRRRVEKYPQDLTLLFERELFSVDNDYQHSTAQFFQVTLDTRQILPLMAYWFIDQDEKDLVITMPIEPWTVQRTNVRLRQMKKRLNACCKGLIEAKLYDHGEPLSSLSSSVLFNLRVDFAHRTVRDFLRLDSIQSRLTAWTKVDFSSDMAVCEGILGQVKATPRDEPFYFSSDGPISDLVDIFDFHMDHMERAVVQHPGSDTAAAALRRSHLREEIRRVLDSADTHTNSVSGNSCG